MVVEVDRRLLQVDHPQIQFIREGVEEGLKVHKEQDSTEGRKVHNVVYFGVFYLMERYIHI